MLALIGSRRGEECERALEPIISLQMPGSVKDIDERVFLIIIMVLLLVTAQRTNSPRSRVTPPMTPSTFSPGQACMRGAGWTHTFGPVLWVD